MKATLVSAADAGFFDLLLGLVASIRAHPQGQELDLCVLDVGLSSEQIQQIRPWITRLVPAQWDLDFPRENCPDTFKAMVSRPFLPRYFPNYHTYVWIDADAWLCNWDAVKLLLLAAQTTGLAIVPELDRAYSHCYNLRPAVTKHLRQTYTEAFGNDAAERYATLPVMNSGVFAMVRDSPYWNTWAEILGPALRRSTGHLVEQCALNVGIYSNRIKAHLLPSWCNWNCAHALPILNPATRELFAPMLPHERISICHPIGLKRREVDIACTDGARRRLALTYKAVHTGELPLPAAKQA